MCGIVAIVGPKMDPVILEGMSRCLTHRGPDHRDERVISSGLGMGHTRLKILDLSDDANQPISSPDGRYTMIYNGEVYNYLELKQQMPEYPFCTQSDSEVVLAAYMKWGKDALNAFNGMFALVIWDREEGTLFAARDRFGVKPLYYTSYDNRLWMASEIKALFAAGIPRRESEEAWAEYLAFGTYPDPEKTFWDGIYPLAGGHYLEWKKGRISSGKWYDFVGAVESKDRDEWTEGEWINRYREVLEDAVQLRFRSDVPVGVNLSGGLDSGILLGIITHQNRDAQGLEAFTFTSGDERYDELPWVRQMIEQTGCHLNVKELQVEDVPELAMRIQLAQDEPYGGFPTLAYSRLFEAARTKGTNVILDGQGLDEQWAGYSYYRHIDASKFHIGPVQGSKTSPVRPNCLVKEFMNLAKPRVFPRPFGDLLRDLQYRDIFHTKIPRALRFNDRISMMHSVELREPMLDYRMVELAVSAPPMLKIRGEEQKWLLRRIGEQIIPKGVALAPKRPVQTPQREWIKGALRPWAQQMIHITLDQYGSRWLDASKVIEEWEKYKEGSVDNSFFVWQWINMGLWAKAYNS